MESKMKHVTFVMACREFFGMLPNETLQEFIAEVRKLTEKDRKDMIEMFRTVELDATKVS